MMRKRSDSKHEGRSSHSAHGGAMSNPKMGAPAGKGQPFLRASAILVAGLLTLSCSLFQAASPAPGPQATAEGMAIATEPQTIEPTAETQTSRPQLICQDPPPEEIPLGSSNPAAIDDPKKVDCYWVQLPPGLDRVTFELNGLSDDLQLAVAYGFISSLQYFFGEYWSSNESGTGAETIVIEDPPNGPYFIRVGAAGFDKTSPYDLTVVTEPETSEAVSGMDLPAEGSCAQPATELELGDEVPGKLASRDQTPVTRSYFCLQVPEGLESLEIEITDMTALLDLFVRQSTPGQWYDRSRNNELLSVVIESPEPGAYFIDVAPALPGTSAEFTLTVSGQ